MTDYEKICLKMREVGAICLQSFTNETDEFEADTNVDFWNIHGKAVIALSYENGDYGLYEFVGESGASVESDLEYIEQLAKLAFKKTDGKDAPVLMTKWS